MSWTATGGQGGPRLSDKDRDRAVDVLTTSCSEGRLTLDEFSERVEAAQRAVSLPDLVPVLEDLPHPFGADLAGLLLEGPERSPVPGAPTLPRSAPDRKATRWTVSVMSGSHRKGRWRLRDRTRAVAVMGGCVLDLRQAEVEGPSAVISAVAVMGGVDIIVPEGIDVELGGIAIMGGKQDRGLRSTPPIPGSPVIRVRAFAFWGGVTVRTKRSRAQLADRDGEDRPHGSGAGRHPGLGGGGRPPGRLVDVVAEGRDGVGDALETGGLPDGTVTIMFSDIEGYTAMTERLGDRRSVELLHEHNALIRRRVAGCGGHEIKAQGDGFMIAFRSASRALECAIGIQQDFEAWNRSRPEAPLRVRLGLHSGEAVRDGNDFLGGAVILAARITQQATGGEVLVSSVLKDLCGPSSEFRFTDGRDVHLKGLSEPRRVYSAVAVPAPRR